MAGGGGGAAHYAPGVRWGEDVTARGVRERRFDVARDGHVVPGLLWTPEAPEQAAGDGAAGAAGEGVPLVLIGHGGSGSKREDYVVALGRRLARHHGLAAAAIDGPVHGDRRGDAVPPPGLTILEFSQRWSSDPKMTDEMVADWRATLDALQTAVGPGPVGWWGLSMGTILGLPFVAAEPRIEVAVFGLMGLTGPTRARLADDAPRLRCPVLFLMQMDDELFPKEAVLALFDAVGSPDKRLHAHPGPHSAVPAEEFRASEEFLARRLLGSPAPALGSR